MFTDTNSEVLYLQQSEVKQKSNCRGDAWPDTHHLPRFPVLVDIGQCPVFICLVNAALDLLTDGWWSQGTEQRWEFYVDGKLLERL